MLAFILILAPWTRAASGWSVHVWRSDGLPEKSIQSLAQTSDGFLWALTPACLVRFDGTVFESFPRRVIGDGLRHRLRALVMSRTGGLWMAVDGGAAAYLGPGKRQLFTEGLPNAMVTALVEDGEGAAWISYYDGEVCRIKDGRILQFTSEQGLPKGRAVLASDRLGRVWFAKGGHLGIFRHGKFETLLQLPRSVTQIAAAPDQGVWICSAESLYRYEEGKPLQNFGAHHGSKPTVILADRSGAVWIGTEYSGLLRFNGSGFESIPTSHREILSLFEDREGNLWVGTDGGGLNRITPRAVQLEGAETGRAMESVRSIREGKDGVLWAIRHDGVLVSRSGTDWTPAFTNSPESSRLLNCLAIDSTGAIWAGTRKQQLLRIADGDVRVWTAADGLGSATIKRLLVGNDRTVWAYGQGPAGLYRLRDGRLSQTEMPPGTRQIVAMTEDSAGRLWLGTDNGGLLQAEGNRAVDRTPRAAPRGVPIRALYGTSDGSLWIGYERGGLGLLTSRGFTRIDVGHGLHNGGIWQIGSDDQGWLWFGSDGGLFKVRQQDLESVAEGRSGRVQSFSYAEAHGLPAQPDFSDESRMLRLKDGRLLVSMGTAVAFINPEKLRDDVTPPPVHVRRVEVDNQTIASYGGLAPATGVDLQDERAIVQPRPGHRKVRFDFSGLSFYAPENIRFRYQLEGFDPDWIEAGAQRTASYPRLHPGTYRFQVKACSSSGIWSETGGGLAVIVAPSVWQTWWFQLAAVGASGAAVIGLVRLISFRRLRRKLRLLEQQAAIHKERIRIARDIHDDAGNRLTKIMLLTSSALRESAEPAKVREQFVRISATAREVADSLDEIVWAVNPGNDALPELIGYVAQFASEFLQSAGIRCQMDLPLHPPPISLPAEVRHNLFLASKEALHNVVRHAQASEVRLRITASKARIEIVIEDNGRGFAPVPEHAGADGLRNMHQRVQEIGGRCEVKSSTAGGTRISFTYWPEARA